jgi:hypothetical protein
MGRRWRGSGRRPRKEERRKEIRKRSDPNGTEARSPDEDY